MARIGIIGAMDSEVTFLKSQVEGPEVVTVAGNEYVVGTLAGKPVVVAKCGVGKVNAAVCAQAMIGRFGAERLVNTGVAGSLDPRLNVGDLVVSTDAVEHDLDLAPLGYAPGEHPDLGVVAFAADEDLRNAVAAAAGEAAADVQVLQGRVCSGDQFIASAQAKSRIVERFGGLCCEMEGAAIAHVCFLNKVPFVVVRVISDNADASSPVSYPEFEKAAAKHCAQIVLGALRLL